jgi:peptide/nickel transport system permease protein
MEIMKTLWQSFTHDRLGLIALGILLTFVIVAVAAGIISPFDPSASNYHPDGRLVLMEPPSPRHWLGTDRFGKDILSQLIYGSRVALSVGLLSALGSTFIGVNIGLVAGFFGGKIDNLLMRITDVVYGIPFLPFAMILVALLGPSLLNVIIAISVISWRTTARVIRSQVLSLKHRTFVEAARVSGCGRWRIIYVHIAPNILSLAFTYTVLTMGWSILTEASLSFLGYGDPELISWGRTLFMAHVAQAMRVAWWWVLPPGLAISTLVLAVYFVGRTFEEITNPRLRRD